jgi:hypothetical protein
MVQPPPEIGGSAVYGPNARLNDFLVRKHFDE